MRSGTRDEHQCERRAPSRPFGTGWFDALVLLLGAAILVLEAGQDFPAPGSAGIQAFVAGLATLELAPPSTPTATALSLLAGPLLVRLPWQAGLAATGAGLLGLVALAWQIERAGAGDFQILPPAIGLAAVYASALLIRSRRRPAMPARASSD